MNWFKKSEKCKVNIDIIYKKIFESSRFHNLQITTLGKIEQYPIFLMKPEIIYPDKKNILIAGGFHGEEPSGSFGIILFIERMLYKYKKYANISFLPIVNPTGIMMGVRENIYHEHSNNGYIHHEELITDETAIADRASTEDKILQKHMSIIMPLAKDGIISLHEDCDKKTFYMYSMNEGKVHLRKLINYFD